MFSNDINSLSKQELCDLLSKKTMELLELMDEKTTSSSIIRDKEVEVKLIQSAITNKKSPERRTA